MYVFVPNPFAILFAYAVLLLVTPIIHKISNQLLHRIGIVGLSNPNYLKLTTISFAMWVIALVLPPIAGFPLALMFLWLNGYFVHVSEGIRKSNRRRSAVIASYITFSVLLGIGFMLAALYYGIALIF